MNSDQHEAVFSDPALDSDARGRGHGTGRAALAGVIGKEPATVEPEFLDILMSNPDRSFPVKERGLAVSVVLC